MSATLADLALFIVAALAGVWLFTSLRELRRWPEPWPAAMGATVVGCVLIYAAAHVHVLLRAEEIQAATSEYRRDGNARRSEYERSGVRGWLLDCTGKDASALVAYRATGDRVQRYFGLGDAGANLVGTDLQGAWRSYSLAALLDSALLIPPAVHGARAFHPAGQDIQLTLCSDVVDTAYRLLRAAGHDGAVVVEDINTGGIIAYAATGGPGDAPLGLRQPSMPGSTQKLVDIAAALESGVPPQQKIACPQSRRFPSGHVMHNADAMPRLLTIPEVIEFSCNTAATELTVSVAKRIGLDSLARLESRLGLTTYGLDADAPRGFDTTFWASGFRDIRNGLAPAYAAIRIAPGARPLDVELTAIGQGPDTWTPLHAARLAQAIAADGVMLQPTLEVRIASSPHRGRRVMRASTAATLRAGMRAVVTHGTAARTLAHRLQGTGWMLAGKTGTAQVEGTKATNAWFTAILSQGSHSRYAIAVLLKGAGAGGDRAAQLVGNLSFYMATNSPTSVRGKD